MSSSEPLHVKLWIGFIIFVLLIGYGVSKTIRIVQPGTVGVPVVFGKVTGEPVQEGLHFVNPITTVLEIVDVKTQLQSVDANAATKDLQDVKSTVAVNYSVERAQAGKLFQTVGRDYYQKVVQPIVMEAFKAESARYTAEELITQRTELSASLLSSLTAALGKRGITVEAISLTQFEFSQELNAAIEKKIIAEQEALQAKNELEKTKVEAQKAEEQARGQALARKAEAEGEAEAIRMKAEAQAEANTKLAESLQENKNVLIYEAIQKWDGKLPTHLFGTPTQVIDVNK